MALSSSARRGLPPLVIACLAATWVVWGSTYLAIKFALVSFPPYLQMGSRFLVAGVALALWMRFVRHAPWPKPRQWAHAVLVGALMLGGGMGGTAVAEQTVGSGLVVAFIAVVPLMIVLVNLFWGVKPGRLEMLGIGVGLVGVLMLTRGAGLCGLAVGLVGDCHGLRHLVARQRTQPARHTAGAGRDGLCQRDDLRRRRVDGAGRGHR